MRMAFIVKQTHLRSLHTFEVCLFVLRFDGKILKRHIDNIMKRMYNLSQGGEMKCR